MNYILFEDAITRTNLLPFTFTRPVADIRIGITTIREKWEKCLGASTSTLTELYLEEKYPMTRGENNILINGSVLPNNEIIAQIKQLKPNQALSYEDYVIAYNISGDTLDKLGEEDLDEVKTTANHIKVNNTWDIFTLNDVVLREDFKCITSGRKSQKLNETNHILGEENIFIEEGAVVNFVTINATTGPVYIGKDAEIMEGAVIRGPFALCEGAVVKMATKIYGATTIGPHSKVGGELSNVVIFGYSNKAHDGFLGNSVLGEWCNLGADTNNSNLKNTYDEVKLWSYAHEAFVPTGLQFCGLIMGDHSKCGINTMFNTGTVVGISANIFGAGFQRNFIASYQWGGVSGFKTFMIERALETIERVMARRNVQLTKVDRKILMYIFELTHKNRTF